MRSERLPTKDLPVIMVTKIRRDLAAIQEQAGFFLADIFQPDIHRSSLQLSAATFGDLALGCQ
jgi:hypothetical protein